VRRTGKKTTSLDEAALAIRNDAGTNLSPVKLESWKNGVK
jgi:hypothetical protein